MSLRKYKRAIARHNMNKQDITHLNKKDRDRKGHRLPSKFSISWKEYIK